MSRPNLPPKQPAEYQIEFGGKISLAYVRCPGIGTDDKQATRWQPSSAHPGHITEPPPNTISDHRAPDRSGNDESDPWGSSRVIPGGFIISGQQVSREQPTARALTPADRQLKFLAPPHPGRSGKHSIAPA